MKNTSSEQGPFDALMTEYETRRQKALAMGGEEKLGKRRAAGMLHARERIDYLVDKDSFLESGLFGTSAAYESERNKTSADGKIAGYARLDEACGNPTGSAHGVHWRILRRAHAGHHGLAGHGNHAR